MTVGFSRREMNETGKCMGWDFYRMFRDMWST